MLKRNDAIIFRKFIQIMFPAFGTAIAVALNEFVDSILVSQLLGSGAMAVVNICSPLMMFAACVYTLFGLGGSMVFSRLIGEKKAEEAKDIFGQAILCALVIGTVSMLLGIAFREPISQVLAGECDFGNELYSYLLYIFLSFPVIMVVMTISSFLPSMNHPVLATGCAIAANAINLLMDFVFISLLNQGVSGAAMATLLGYAVVGIVLLILFAGKKIAVSFSSAIRSINVKCITDIMKMGLADASIQLGFALTWGFCNNLAASFGNDALVAFSFFMQLGSIISVFLAGICEGAVPVYSLLYGADDRQGIKMLTKKGLMILEICSVALVLLFLVFPGALLELFRIESAAQKAICLRSIRAFAIYAPVRSAVVFYRIVLNAGGKIKYATTLSIVDGIVGVFVFSYLGTAIWGVDGLWYAYIMNMTAIVILIICLNTYLYHKSNKQISMVYLTPENPDKYMLDLTILSEGAVISQISEKAIRCCSEHGYSHQISTFAGILIEEMAVYTRNHCGDHQYLDILMKQEQDSIKIDFRSIGKPFNPMMESGMDEHYNIEMMNKLADKIVYVYAMGLNTTSIILRGDLKGERQGNHC